MKAAMAGEFLEGFGQARTEGVCLHCLSSPISLLSAVTVGRDLQAAWQAAGNSVFAIAA